MTLRILIFALTLTAIHAQEPPSLPLTATPVLSVPVDPGITYLNARIAALEADNAALKRTIQLQKNQLAAWLAVVNSQMPVGDEQQLQAAQATAQKALDAARNALKKACGDKWDEKASKCGN